MPQFFVHGIATRSVCAKKIDHFISLAKPQWCRHVLFDGSDCNVYFGIIFLTPPLGHGAGLSAVWQHFVNSVIQLTLEAKKSNKDGLESVRSRILWMIDSGNDLISGSNKEVCFVSCRFLVS